MSIQQVKVPCYVCREWKPVEDCIAVDSWEPDWLCITCDIAWKLEGHPLSDKDDRQRTMQWAYDMTRI